MERRFDELERNLSERDGRLKKMAPITADIGRWKERFIGMLLLIVVMAATFGATLATFCKWIAVKLGLGVVGLSYRPFFFFGLGLAAALYNCHPCFYTGCDKAVRAISAARLACQNCTVGQSARRDVPDALPQPVSD